MLNEEEKKAIEFLQEFTPKNYWRDPINVGNNWVIEDDVYLKYNINIVLNIIEKLQKENEYLLREKEENKFIIAMANNEMLGYNQGYSDAKNQTSNATEIVVKNRQAYMHKEEVEFYIKNRFLQKRK